MGPTTKIEILNNAAILLGRKPFATVSDSDEFAVSLQKFYDMLVPSELSKNHWKFSKKYIQLSKTTPEPDFANFSASYQLPADYLSAVRVYPGVYYEIFKDKLYTSTGGELKLEYNYDVPVSFWSPSFKEYMTYALASKVSAAVTENPQMTSIIMSEMRKARAEAMWVDAQSSPNVPFVDRPWIRARKFASSDDINNSFWN